MWHQMNMEEFANFERANGIKVIKHDNIWWQQIRLFFYRPLFPFQEISLEASHPPNISRCMGYQHILPSRENANSYINFIVIDNLPDFLPYFLISRHWRKLAGFARVFFSLLVASFIPSPFLIRNEVTKVPVRPMPKRQ